MNGYKELNVLIVEDDDGHALLVEEGLRDSGICNPMLRFSNGEEVWQFLSGSGNGQVRDKEKSYLVLLDINMPIMGGIEVLELVKQTEDLKEIPIIMLTTTDDPVEVEQCYLKGCNAYVTKPIEFGKFSETLQRLGLFIQIVKV